MNWQPTLNGKFLKLRPLKSTDFEVLYAAASDLKIWEQHPQSTRYQREVFQKFFDGAIASGGAFLIQDQKTDEVIGSSRYYDHKPQENSVIIGYTFLIRRCWGGEYNRELKALMLDYAFRTVDRVLFEIGAQNLRSQKAIQKIGAHKTAERQLDGAHHFIYEIKTSSQHG